MTEISRAKVEELAKKGHVKCHGRGILGHRPGTNIPVLCTCVFRNLRRRDVNIYARGEVEKYLAQDPPTSTTPGDPA